MPKNAIDYSKSVIYKIQHIENFDLLYVGSTTDFIKRKSTHKDRCKESYKTKNLLYNMIRENGGWDNFKMIIIKEFPCDTKTELLIEEDKLMIEMKTNMNKYKSFVDKEDKKEWYKRYNDMNKEAKSKIIKCECGCEIQSREKARHMKSKKHLSLIKV